MMEPRGSGKYQLDCPFMRAKAGIVHLENNHTFFPVAGHSTLEGECLRVGYAHPCNGPHLLMEFYK